MKKIKTGIKLLFLLTLYSIFSPASGFSQCAGNFTANAGADLTRCTGSPGVTLGGISTGGTPPYTYQWVPATGLSCSNCPNPVSTNNVTIIYTLTVYDADSSCIASDQVTVTMASNPTASFTFSSALACSNLPVQFTNTSTGAGLSFSWNFGDPLSGAANTSSAINPTHFFQATGTGNQNFNVTLTVTNANGCQTAFTQVVTVKQTPPLMLDDPFMGFKNCDGTSFNLNVTESSGGSGISNYQIQWGDGSVNFNSPTFPAGGVTHIYSTQEIFDLRYIVTGTNGCIDTLRKIVTNITNPAIGAANPGGTNGCGPLEICFPLSNFEFNHPSTTYRVDFGDGSPILNLPHPPPTVLCHTYSQISCGFPGNSFTFRMKAINLCDSSEATITPIRVYKPPVAAFQPNPNPACTGSSVLFTNLSAPGSNSNCNNLTSYQWDFGDGSALLNTTTLTSPSHTYLSPGTYTVTLTATSVTCGSSSAVKTVCIENPPVPSFSLDRIVACVPFVSQTTNLSTTANTCNVTYNWSVIFNGSTCTPSAGTWSFTGGTSASSISPKFQFSSPGTYTIRLALTNSCGTFNFTKDVTAQGVPQVTVNPLTSICAGLSVLPSATVNSCYEPADTYNWTFPGASPTSSSLLAPGTITYSSAGNFTLNLQATNQCGSATGSTTLVVKPFAPALNPTVNSPLCVGSTAQFISAAVAGVSYVWAGPNGFTSSLQNPQIVNVQTIHAGNYTVNASLNGCPGPQQTVNLVVNPLPVVNAGNDFAICKNAPAVTLTGTPAGGTWSGTGISSGGLFVPSVAGTFSFTYSYSPAGGCPGSDVVSVTVNPLPTPSAGADLSLCNQPVASNLTGTPAGGTWSGTGITNPSGQFTPFSTGSFPVVYTVTNTAGCVNKDTTIIQVVNPSNSNAGTDRTLCADAANVQLAGIPSGGTWTGTGINASGLFYPTAAGNFPMVYTFGTGTCLTRDTMRFIVNPLPLVNAGNDFAMCENSPAIALTGSPSGGSWSGTGISVAGVFNPASAGNGNHTLVYTYLNTATGCIGTDIVVATVKAKPVVSAGNDLSLCNQPIAVTLTGTPAGGTWAGTGITNPSGQYTPAGIGSFPVVYTFTHSNGCTNKDTLLVHVGNPSNASAGVDSTVCVDAANVQLTGTPAAGTWTGTGVNASGLFDPTVTGNFNLVYHVGAGTCISRDTMKVIVNPLPVVNAGMDFSVCIDAPGSTLNGSPYGGSWTGTGINASGFFNPALAGAGSFALTYTYTDPLTHCRNTDIVNAKVNPLPVVNAGNDTILCNQSIGVILHGLPTGGVWSGTNVTPNGVFTPSGTGNTALTYTYTAATGCNASDNIQIQVINAQLANAGVNKEICIHAQAVQLSGLPAGGTWSGTGITASGLFTPNTAGSFPLVYTYGGGNCLTRDTMIYTVHALPIVNTGTDKTFCLSAPAVNFAAMPINGSWSGTGITQVNIGTFNPSVAGTGTFPIVYTYTHPVTGCTNKDTLLAIVRPLPVPGFTFNPVICANTAEIFTNTTGPSNTYVWDFGDGGSAVAANPSHTFTTIGFFDVQLVATSAFGCVDSITKNIEVREPPLANFTLSPDSACAPVIVAFTNHSSGIAVTYAWNFGNGQNSSLQNPVNVTYQQGVLADTTYSVQLSVTNICGTSTHTETVVAMPKPKAVFGTNFDVGCSPFTVQIANNSIGLPDTYFWDFGDGTTATTANALLSHVFTTGQSDTVYTIMLVVANECGRDTSYHNITVLPNQVNAFFNTNTTSGCVPLTVNFTQFSTGANAYNWDFGDANTSAVFSPTHTFTTAGTFTVSLIINDGCSFDTASVDITVFPSPIVDFSAMPDSVCINEPFVFTNLSAGLSASAWSFGDGQNSALTNPTHAYANSGTYQVTLTGTSQTNNCTASKTRPVVVSVNPVAAFSANPISGCAPLQVAFANTSTNAAFHTWTFGDGNFSGQLSPVHIFQNAGTYTVKLLVENTNGCRDSISKVITVYPVPVANFTISTSNACFSPMTISTTNTSTGAVDYAWNLGNGSNSTLTNPSAVYNTPGTYSIQLTASNAYGCSDVHMVNVTVYPTPLASFTISEDTICAGQSVKFTSTSSFADSVVWFTGDGNQLSGNNITHQYGTAGIYTITAIAYGAGGCSDTFTLNSDILVYPTPVADFDYVNIQNPDPLSGTVEFTNLSIGATSYNWDFGNGATSHETNPIERYNAYGDFGASLIATNQFGCSDTIYQLVVVDFFNGLFVPNAIYPAHPDFGVANFLPKGVGLATYEILIYDDWGNLIWESTALDPDGRPTGYWNGTFNGEAVQQDAYVWKVSATFLDTKIWRGKEYPGGKFRKSGTVTVIR